MALSKKQCIPCRRETPRLEGKILEEYCSLLSGWTAVGEQYLTKTYPFPDFTSGLAFVNRVGELAEQEDHHPDIYLTWGKVEVKIYTYIIKGLSENDFILAAKIDEVLGLNKK